MIEAVGDDRVRLVEQRLEHAAVGVETRGEQNRIDHVEVFCDSPFKLAVQGLGAADEAHRRHAKTVGFQCAARGRDDLGMIGEAQIVVGAQIDHFASADADASALRPFDQPFVLIEPVGLDLSERRAEVGVEV